MPQQPIDCLLLGAATADLVGGTRILGGTVSYAAPVLHAFGLRVGIVTSAQAADPLLESLRNHAVLAVKTAAATTTFENRYAPDGTREQFLHASAAPLSIDDVPQAWRGVPLVHLAPLAQEFDPSIATAFPQATVLLTPQGFMRQWNEDKRVRFYRWFDADALRHIQIVVFSHHDIAAAPELEALFAQAVETLIVTDGAQGGTIYHHGKPQHYDAFPAQELDPTGAGDVFAAAYLAAIGRGFAAMSAAQIAARLAACSVGRVGPSESVQPAEVILALSELDGESGD